MPFDEAVRQLRPGQWDARVLDQDRAWVDSAATVRLLRDLGDTHLVNVVTMLRRDALRLLVEHEAATDPTGARFAKLGQVLRGAAPVVPVWEAAADWIEHTPLWGALQAELERRGLTAPNEFARIDQTSGVWAVRTSDEVHVLNLHDQCTLRLRDSRALTRARSRPIKPVWHKLRHVGPVQLGRNMQMDVVRPTGKVVGRVAGPVTGIRLLPPGLSEGEVVNRALHGWQGDAQAWAVTQYRTVQFVDVAALVRDHWAGLHRALDDAGVTGGVLIVPRLMRQPGAEPSAADLCLSGAQPDQAGSLQRRVDEVIGFHLPLTSPADYPERDVAQHAVMFAPGL